MFCGKNEGFMKRIEKRKWCHPICAFYSGQVEVENFSTMKFSLVNAVQCQEKSASCIFCQTDKGLTLCCMDPACSMAAHAFCAFQHKANAMKENPDFEVGWLIQLQLSKQPNKAFLPEIKKYIEEGIPSDNACVDINMDNTSIIDTKKTVEIGQTDVKTKNKVYTSIGGNITIYCEAHKPSKELCICANKASSLKNEEQMISCDICGNTNKTNIIDNMYHIDCINITVAQSKLLKYYVCEMCKSWQSLSKDYLQAVFK